MPTVRQPRERDLVPLQLWPVMVRRRDAALSEARRGQQMTTLYCIECGEFLAEVEYGEEVCGMQHEEC